MNNKSYFLLVVALLLCAGLLCRVAIADEAREKAAVDASKAWLALVDGGKYADSWAQSASIFQSSITKADWEKSLGAVRKPLGKVLSRKLSSKKYTTTLPGAPDGEYVVIQYETSFEKKASAIETITPMLDKDGKWRVSGYYIK